MIRRHRKMLLNLVTGIAVAAAAVAVFLPAAQAAPGVVTSNVNVRSGPGTNYAPVDTIVRGTQVDVQQCQGSWCYISKPGPDGWVSATYLSAGGRPVNPQQPGFSFGFSTGPGGPNISIGVGQQPQVQPPFGGPGRPPIGGPGFPGGPGRPPIGGPGFPGGPGPGRPVPLPTPIYSEVCFYDRSDFRGQSQCLESGDSVARLGSFADRISSIDNPDGLNVQVCAEDNFRNCRTYTTSASRLGDFDDYIRSIRIR